MLKTYNEDGANGTIGGIQKISDADLRNGVVQIILEEFAAQGGVGHVNFTDGDVIGTFTDSYWPYNYGENIDRETVTYDFEDGAQGWVFDASGFGLQTDTTLGSQCIGCDISGAPRQLAHIEPAELAGGVQVNYVEFSYWETSSSTGGGLLLKDNNGNEVIGAATDNPQWAIFDANSGANVNTSGNSYQTWYTVRIFFDWSAGTATVSWYNSSGTLLQSESGRPLINNTNVARLDVQNYTSGIFQGSTNCYMRVDNVKFEYPVSYVPQTETRDIYQNWSDPGSASVPYLLMEYDNSDGNLHGLTKSQLMNHVIDLALDELVNNEGPGSFRIFEGTSLPGDVTGSWETIGTIVDDQTQSGSTAYTLWKKVSNSSSNDTLPLKWNSTLGGLQKTTPTEIQQLVDLLKEKMFNTSVGRYNFSVTAPSTGTWQSVSTVNDERAQDSPTSYTRSYQEATYYGSTSSTYATYREGFYGTYRRGYYGTYRSVSYSTYRIEYSYLGNTQYYGLRTVEYFGRRTQDFYGRRTEDFYGERITYSSTASGGRFSTESFSGDVLSTPDETVLQYKLWVRLG